MQFANITKNTTYFGSFDVAIIGFVREYRQQKHKDIGCFDIKQKNYFIIVNNYNTLSSVDIRLYQVYNFTDCYFE